ncbi:unnamed protein product [Prunus brigantina]
MCVFDLLVAEFQYEKDKDQQHMLFLLYWLNRFVFPNRSSTVLLEYKHLVEALHNHADVGLGPTVLAHLYKNLHNPTLESPLNISTPGVFWMIQVWLQVYFPELRFPNIVLPEDQVMAAPLLSTKVPKCSIEEYLKFFRHCTKRSATQWQVVLRRSYPWFQPGHRLFVKEREEEEAKIDFRKKFLSVTLPRDMPFGGGKPPNYHLGAEVYHPNFCARQLGCPQLIPLKSYMSCNRATSWRDLDYLNVHMDCRCSVNKINNSVDALYPSWEPNSCSSGEFDAWWKARFAGLPDSSVAVKTLFETWDVGTVLAEPEAKKFIVQMVKGINAQVIEDPSMTNNLGKQSVQAGEVVVTSIIAAGDLKLPFGDEQDDYETLAEVSVETTPSVRRNKRKEATYAQDSAVQPALHLILTSFLCTTESCPPPSKVKKLRKKAVNEAEEREEPVTAPTETTETDEELRDAFEAIEQEKGQQEGEEDVPLKKQDKESDEEEIPAEVIAESIALAKQQEEAQSTEPTSSELALFDDMEAEHSAAAPEPDAEAELPSVVPVPEVAEDKIAGVLAVVTSPSKPPIVQSIELDLDENQGVVDQLMKDLDLLHRENMPPRPILELSLGLARDVLNLHNRYEDLKPSFMASEFCKAIHEANLADYAKQKTEMDQMVTGYKEAKTAANKLEKQIEELQKQLAGLRERQNKIEVGLGTKTKATFLVQNMVAASRPTLEIAEASLHQGMLLQQEISSTTCH